MRVTLSSKGDWKKTRAWFEKMQRKEYLKVLNRYGQQGVDALRSMTPVDSGQTASMWSYEVAASGSGAEIKWLNHNFNGGVNIAIILQYGHGTGTGVYVSGRDYINPAIKPVMDMIAEEVWRVVTSA